MVEGRISELSPVISGVPQGTVLGPVLFLLHISDIAKDVSQASNTSSYVDDTRVSRRIRDKQADCSALQQDLSSIYSWASEVNMVFNSEKFESLRYWPRGNKPDTSYKSPDGSDIEEKLHLRDLGVEISSDLTFNTHIAKVVSAANQLVAWSLRTFKRRSKHMMLTLWKSLIQSKLDYTSQLWSPKVLANLKVLQETSQLGLKAWLTMTTGIAYKHSPSTLRREGGTDTG